MKAAPPSPDGNHLCEQAFVLLESGRLDEAHALLTQAKVLLPKSPRVHYLLALCFGDKGQVKDALDAIDTSLRLDPINPKAHNNRGSALLQLGRTGEAEAAFRLALEHGPDLAPPYINLGHLLEQQGQLEQAAQVYDRAIERGLDRATFEQYRAVARRQRTNASPENWVRDTFDNFAPAFDQRLHALGYRVPQDLAQRLATRVTGLLDILDLGCGTGACGVVLAGNKRRLAGVDLSPKMLQQAALHGIYDDLQVDEIQAYLRRDADTSHDVVLAADVFVYIGALEEVFRETSRVLRPGGWFAFSTEEQDQVDFELLSTGRYAHSQAYIQRLATPDFQVHESAPTVIRTESGKPIKGRLYLLRKSDYSRP
jgi:predicted TPR repeat methyltransferase